MTQIFARFGATEVSTNASFTPALPSRIKPVRPEGAPVARPRLQTGSGLQCVELPFQQTRSCPEPYAPTPRLPQIHSPQGSPRSQALQGMFGIPSRADAESPRRRLRGRQVRAPAILPSLEQDVADTKGVPQPVLDLDPRQDFSLDASFKGTMAALKTKVKHRSSPEIGEPEIQELSENHRSLSMPSYRGAADVFPKETVSILRAHAVHDNELGDALVKPRPRSLSQSELPDICGATQKVTALLNGDCSEEAIAEAIGKVFISTEAEKAEALVLQDEAVRKFDGLDALAYVLERRLGTLEEAFAWLDFSGTGHFTRVAFETAMAVFNIDTEKLTGMSRQLLFSSLDVARTSSVSRQAWYSYFEEIQDSQLKASLFRSKPQVTKVDDVVKTKSSGRAYRVAEVPKEVATIIHEPYIPTKEPSRVADAPKSEPGVELNPAPVEVEPASPKESGAKNRTPSRKRGRASTRKTTRRMERADSRPPPAAKEIPQEPSCIDAPKRRAIMSPESLPDTLGSGDDFEERVRQQLSVVDYDDCYVFDTLKRQERVIVDTVCTEMNFYSYQAGSALVAFRLSERGWWLKDKLETLRPGEGRELDIPDSLRKFCSMWAQHSGIWLRMLSADADNSLDYGALRVNGSMDEFRDGIRATLQSLGIGETARFPAELSKRQFRAIEDVASDRDLVASFVDPCRGKRLHVGNLSEFASDVQAMIDALPDGGSVTFGPNLRLLKVEVVTSKAKNASCYVKSSTPSSVTVERVVAPSNHSVDAPINKTERNNYEAAFNKYSTRASMKKLDLCRLIADLKDAVGNLRNSATTIQVKMESLFDDTLELQRDLGSRCNNGLNLQYFKVFLDKVGRDLGLSIGTVLSELVESSYSSEEPCEAAVDLV